LSRDKNVTTDDVFDLKPSSTQNLAAISKFFLEKFYANFFIFTQVEQTIRDNNVEYSLQINWELSLRAKIGVAKI
jgi:hypothetical protein